MDTLFRRALIRSLGVSLGIILAAVSVTFFFRSDIEARGAAIERLRTDARERTEAIQSLFILRKEAVTAVPFREILIKRLPEEEDLFQFRSRVREFAQNAGVLVEFKFGAAVPSAGGNPPAVNIQLSASGGEENFLRFLESLEESDYFVRFDTIDISYAGAAGARITAALSGKVFSR